MSAPEVGVSPQRSGALPSADENTSSFLLHTVNTKYNNNNNGTTGTEGKGAHQYTSTIREPTHHQQVNSVHVLALQENNGKGNGGGVGGDEEEKEGGNGSSSPVSHPYAFVDDLLRGADAAAAVRKSTTDQAEVVEEQQQLQQHFQDPSNSINRSGHDAFSYSRVPSLSHQHQHQYQHHHQGGQVNLNGSLPVGHHQQTYAHGSGNFVGGDNGDSNHGNNGDNTHNTNSTQQQQQQYFSPSASCSTLVVAASSPPPPSYAVANMGYGGGLSSFPLHHSSPHHQQGIGGDSTLTNNNGNTLTQSNYYLQNVSSTGGHGHVGVGHSTSAHHVIAGGQLCSSTTSAYAPYNTGTSMGMGVGGGAAGSTSLTAACSPSSSCLLGMPSSSIGHLPQPHQPGGGGGGGGGGPVVGYYQPYFQATSPTTVSSTTAAPPPPLRAAPPLLGTNHQISNAYGQQNQNTLSYGHQQHQQQHQHQMSPIATPNHQSVFMGVGGGVGPHPSQSQQFFSNDNNTYSSNAPLSPSAAHMMPIRLVDGAANGNLNPPLNNGGIIAANGNVGVVQPPQGSSGTDNSNRNNNSHHPHHQQQQVSSIFTSSSHPGSQQVTPHALASQHQGYGGAGHMGGSVAPSAPPQPHPSSLVGIAMNSSSAVVNGSGGGGPSSFSASVSMASNPNLFFTSASRTTGMHAPTIVSTGIPNPTTTPNNSNSTHANATAMMMMMDEHHRQQQYYPLGSIPPVHHNSPQQSSSLSAGVGAGAGAGAGMGVVVVTPPPATQVFSSISGELMGTLPQQQQGLILVHSTQPSLNAVATTTSSSLAAKNSSTNSSKSLTPLASAAAAGGAPPLGVSSVPPPAPLNQSPNQVYEFKNYINIGALTNILGTDAAAAAASSSATVVTASSFSSVTESNGRKGGDMRQTNRKDEDIPVSTIHVPVESSSVSMCGGGQSSKMEKQEEGDAKPTNNAEGKRDAKGGKGLKETTVGEKVGVENKSARDDNEEMDRTLSAEGQEQSSPTSAIEGEVKKAGADLNPEKAASNDSRLPKAQTSPTSSSSAAATAMKDAVVQHCGLAQPQPHLPIPTPDDDDDDGLSPRPYISHRHSEPPLLNKSPSAHEDHLHDAFQCGGGANVGGGGCGGNNVSTVSSGGGLGGGANKCEHRPPLRFGASSAEPECLQHGGTEEDAFGENVATSITTAHREKNNTIGTSTCISGGNVKGSDDKLNLQTAPRAPEVVRGIKTAESIAGIVGSLPPSATSLPAPPNRDRVKPLATDGVTDLTDQKEAKIEGDGFLKAIDMPEMERSDHYNCGQPSPTEMSATLPVREKGKSEGKSSTKNKKAGGGVTVSFDYYLKQQKAREEAQRIAAGVGGDEIVGLSSPLANTPLLHTTNDGIANTHDSDSPTTAAAAAAPTYPNPPKNSLGVEMPFGVENDHSSSSSSFPVAVATAVPPANLKSFLNGSATHGNANANANATAAISNSCFPAPAPSIYVSVVPHAPGHDQPLQVKVGYRPPNAPVALPPGTTPGAGIDQRKRKTRFCKTYPANIASCAFGDKCAFAHYRDEYCGKGAAAAGAAEHVSGSTHSLPQYPQNNKSFSQHLLQQSGNPHLLQTTAAFLGGHPSSLDHQGQYHQQHSQQQHHHQQQQTQSRAGDRGVPLHLPHQSTLQYHNNSQQQQRQAYHHHHHQATANINSTNNNYNYHQNHHPNHSSSNNNNNNNNQQQQSSHYYFDAPPVMGGREGSEMAHYQQQQQQQQHTPVFFSQSTTSANFTYLNVSPNASMSGLGVMAGSSPSPTGAVGQQTTSATAIHFNNPSRGHHNLAISNTHTNNSINSNYNNNNNNTNGNQHPHQYQSSNYGESVHQQQQRGNSHDNINNNNNNNNGVGGRGGSFSVMSTPMGGTVFLPSSVLAGAASPPNYGTVGGGSETASPVTVGIAQHMPMSMVGLGVGRGGVGVGLGGEVETAHYQNHHNGQLQSHPGNRGATETEVGGGLLPPPTYQTVYNNNNNNNHHHNPHDTYSGDRGGAREVGGESNTHPRKSHPYHDDGFEQSQQHQQQFQQHQHRYANAHADNAGTYGIGGGTSNTDNTSTFTQQYYSQYQQQQQQQHSQGQRHSRMLSSSSSSVHVPMSTVSTQLPMPSEREPK